MNDKPQWVPSSYEQSLNRIKRLGPLPYIHVWHTVRLNGELFASVGYSTKIEGFVFRPRDEMSTVLHSSEIGQILGGN